MPSNPLNPRMEFSPADVLTLEVEQWPELEAERNLFPNPWPAPIEYGWTSNVGAVQAPPVETSWRRPWRAAALTSITATAPRVVEIVPETAPADLGVSVGDTVFVLNVPELQRPDEPGSEWTYNDALTGANGEQPQYLTVTAVTETTITANCETNPPALEVGPVTVPSNAYLRTEGAAFVWEVSDLEGETIGEPWGAVMRTPDIPVAPGFWVRFGADVVGQVRVLLESVGGSEVWDTPVDDSHLLEMTLRFHDTDGEEVGSASWIRPVGGDGTQTNTDRPLPLDNTSATLVPDGAVSVRVEVAATLTTSDYLDPVRLFMPFSAVRLYQAPLEADLPGYAEYVYPPAPVDVFGDISGSLTITRAALDASTMSFRLVGDAYDPVQTEVLVPGKRVQLRLTDPETGAVEPLFTGAIADPLLAEYPIRNRRVVPITTVTCVDPIAKFAAAPHPNGAYGWRAMREMLETVPSPSMVQSDETVTETDTVPFWIDDATVLDHVVIVRDTWQAYAWIDRHGVLRLMSRGAVESPIGWVRPPRTFSVDEDNFLASMTPSYSSDRLLNQIKVKALRHIGDQTEEWSYGPYVDSVSRAKYGPREATFTVSTDPLAVYGDDAFDGYAAEILARSSVPVVLFSPVPFRIMRLADLEHASADLMDVFEITAPSVGFESVPHRAWKISHEISVSSWTMTAEFERQYETQTPTVTPSAKDNRAANGWQELTLNSGFTPAGAGYPCRVTLRGDLVIVEGRVSGTFPANTPTNVCVIPEGYRPEPDHVGFGLATSNATSGRLYVSDDGILTAHAAAAVSNIWINCSYLRRPTD